MLKIRYAASLTTLKSLSNKVKDNGVNSGNKNDKSKNLSNLSILNRLIREDFFYFNAKKTFNLS